MALQELLEKRQGLLVKQEDIINAIRKENRNMTVDEKSKWDKVENEISNIEETAERLEKFNENKGKEFENNFIPSNFAKTQGQTQDKSFGLGEMLASVAKAALPPGQIPGAGQFDNRLVQNAASGHSATVPSEGGFLINPTKSNEIMQKVYDNSEIIKECRTYEIGENSDSLEVPYVDETSRVNGSRWGGLRAYRAGEVETPTSSKTKLGKWECQLSDLKALVYVTERLLRDAAALESLIMDQMPEEFLFKLQDEIVNGEGGSKCKGIIGDNATVSIAKETGQDAATILSENIIKMYTRCWGRSRGRAKWYHNQDIEPELLTLALNVGTGGVPLYMPPSGLSGSPYSTLMGKPLVPVEQAQTLGTVGDIMLADFSEYALIKKGGINMASSIHVKFLTDEMTFKFNYRINGKPKWKSALTPFKGTNTLSPFVTLATRA